MHKTFPWIISLQRNACKIEGLREIHYRQAW